MLKTKNLDEADGKGTASNGHILGRSTTNPSTFSFFAPNPRIPKENPRQLPRGSVCF